MIQQVRPRIVWLQETKLDSISDQLAAEFLGSCCWGYEYLQADDTKGGILVAWDQDWISAEGPHRKRYSISLRMTLRISNTAFWITVVYGPTESSEKTQFLNELVSCLPSELISCCVWATSILSVRPKIKIMGTSIGGKCRNSDGRWMPVSSWKSN